jgi:Beta-propeller repeat
MTSGPLTLSAFAIAVVGLGVAAASAADPAWIQQFGTGEWDSANAVATDADGNVYIVGDTQGSLGGPLIGNIDAWIIKVDPDGNQIWKQQFGTRKSDYVEAAATDGNGNLYVVGRTVGMLGGPKHGDVSDGDAWVAKFDPNGQVLWKHQPGTSSWDEAKGVATDPDGNVYVAGSTRGSLGGPSRGPSDVFVLKFDRDGRYVWKRQPGTRSSEWPEGVATDADGNVYVVGQTLGALGRPSSHGKYDAFVIKFDRDGRYLWKRQPGTRQSDSAMAVATDAGGNAYIAGWTEGTWGGPHQGYRDAFVARFDADGRYLWRRQPGSWWTDTAQGVATHGGNVYIAGQTPLSLSGEAAPPDAYVIPFDADGNQLGRVQSGTQKEEMVEGMAIDADGNVYVVGNTAGALGGPQQGIYDAFVIKYAAGSIE